MGQGIVLTTLFNLVLIWSVHGIRISPKLDFGDSDKTERRTLTSGFRPEFETRYLNSDGAKLHYRRENGEPEKATSVGVICVSGNCNDTEVKGGVSTDVLVHIKTNVDVGKSKNETTEAVPDVPIIVGTKSGSATTINSNGPVQVSNPTITRYDGSSYPAANFLPSLSTGNPFMLPARSDFGQNSVLQTDSQIRGGGLPGYASYAPRFQGNGIELQPGYPPSSFNNFNNPRYAPPLRRDGNGGYNPLEFRKTYRNTWTPVIRNGIGPSPEYRTGNAIPRWTPCVCQNQEQHNHPTTPGYQQYNQPSGINGKLAI